MKQQPSIIPKASEIQFTKADGYAPGTNCASCGRPLAAMARVGVLKYDGGSFHMYLCGERCENEIKTHPSADKYIAAQLAGLAFRMS